MNYFYTSSGLIILFQRFLYIFWHGKVFKFSVLLNAKKQSLTSRLLLRQGYVLYILAGSQKGRKKEIGLKKRDTILIFFPCFIQALMTAQKRKKNRGRGEIFLSCHNIYACIKEEDEMIDLGLLRDELDLVLKVQYLSISTTNLNPSIPSSSPAPFLF